MKIKTKDTKKIKKPFKKSKVKRSKVKRSKNKTLKIKRLIQKGGVHEVLKSFIIFIIFFTNRLISLYQKPVYPEEFKYKYIENPDLRHELLTSIHTIMRHEELSKMIPRHTDKAFPLARLPYAETVIANKFVHPHIVRIAGGLGPRDTKKILAFILRSFNKNVFRFTTDNEGSPTIELERLILNILKEVIVDIENEYPRLTLKNGLLDHLVHNFVYLDFFLSDKYQEEAISYIFEIIRFYHIR